jgi:hypothetical protein
LYSISSNSDGSKKLPDDGRLLPKHVGAIVRIKEWYKSVLIVGHFYYSIIIFNFFTTTTNITVIVIIIIIIIILFFTINY